MNIKEGIKFSDPKFFKAADREDKKFGIDFWMCGIPFAFRKRKIKCPGDISIRHTVKSGQKTEYMKLLEGSFRSKIYMYEFTDCVIFVQTRSIVLALQDHNFMVIDNKDGSKGAYISLDPFLLKFLKTGRG